MSRYSHEIVADVLAATDVVELLGASLELKPAGGGRFKGLCPFHDEKTPSFSVNRDRQMYYCFGCQKSGDAITFLREFEGLSFAEAVRKLADRAGIALPAMSERDNKDEFQRKQLLAFGVFAAKFFSDMLSNPLKGGLARKYLQGRHLKPETVARFGLGYAPPGWSNLLDAARKAGFKDHLIESSGMARRKDGGGLYDFFRNRLVVPIRDVSGNRVAFGGRTLEDDSAKYINSPENPVYKKSRVLYGLHEARDAVRRAKQAVLVEGYFDLLRCFDVGIENVLAPCGTALTTEQAKLIRRYAQEVVIVFDGDAAGVRAALRSIGILAAEGLAVRALVLPDGQDPDDYVQQAGAEAFRELLAKAPDFVAFYVQANAGRIRTIEGRTEVARELFPILENITDAIRRDEYLKRAAELLGVDAWLCREEFTKSLRQKAARRPRATADEPNEAPAPVVTPEESSFVAILLQDKTLLELTRNELTDCPLSSGPFTEVLELMYQGETGSTHFETASAGARALYASASNQDLTRLGDSPQHFVKAYLARAKKSVLLAEEAQVMEAVRSAERARDPARAAALIARKGELRRQIEAVGAA